MADNIVTVTATISSSHPAIFPVSNGQNVEVYGSFTYQWDTTTNTLVNPGTGSKPTPPATQFITGTMYAYNASTHATTTFTSPIFSFSGSVGGVAEIFFQTPTGGNLEALFLDWQGENPASLYTGTNSKPGGAQYSSIKEVNGRTSTTHHISSTGGGTITTQDTCFAAGTLIMTTKGEVAVENLAVGDVVITADGAEEKIAWLGHRAIKVMGANKDFKYLVRISAGAVAPGLPRRDLLVTQDHCLLLDGVLVPARMLVNGATITLDQTMTAYTYYHVELARHAVILAEGLAAESYLDTGNRGNFANADMVALAPSFGVDAGDHAWSKAAAPLAVDRATVEPIWRRLADRAAALGLAARAPVLTEDAGLHLVTEAGQALWPVAVRDGRFMFMLPAGTGAVRLRSRASRPSDVTGPFVDDRRMLGVQVAAMTLTQGRRPVALQPEGSANGWHAASAAEAGCWTDGDAALALPGNNGMAGVLEIQLLAAGPYVVEGVARIAA